MLADLVTQGALKFQLVAQYAIPALQLPRTRGNAAPEPRDMALTLMEPHPARPLVI